jgi:hypothetical protein
MNESIIKEFTGKKAKENESPLGILEIKKVIRRIKYKGIKILKFPRFLL